MSQSKDLFRKSSLDRISSPEMLNEYIKISRPSIWILLGAILVLVIAAAIWASTAVITSDGLRPIDFLFS